MEYFEEMALGKTILNITAWLSYVYETVILWPSKEAVETMLNHVKSIRRLIHFHNGRKINN